VPNHNTSGQETKGGSFRPVFPTKSSTNSETNFPGTDNGTMPEESGNSIIESFSDVPNQIAQQIKQTQQSIARKDKEITQKNSLLQALHREMTKAEQDEVAAAHSTGAYRVDMQDVASLMASDTANVTQSFDKKNRDKCDRLISQPQFNTFVNDSLGTFPPLKKGIAAACMSNIISPEPSSEDVSYQKTLFSKPISQTNAGGAGVYALCPRDSQGTYKFDSSYEGTFHCLDEEGNRGEITVSHAKAADTSNPNFDSLQCIYQSDKCIPDHAKIKNLGDHGIISSGGDRILENFKYRSSRPTQSPETKKYQKSLNQAIQVEQTPSPKAVATNTSGEGIDCSGFAATQNIPTLSPKNAPYQRQNAGVLSENSSCSATDIAALTQKSSHPFLVTNSSNTGDHPYIMKDGYLYKSKNSLSSYQGNPDSHQSQNIQSMAENIESRQPVAHRNMCSPYPVGTTKKGVDGESHTCCMDANSGVGPSWQRGGCPTSSTNYKLPAVNINEDCFYSIPVVDNWLRTFTKEGKSTLQDYSKSVDYDKSYKEDKNKFVYEIQRGNSPSTFASKNQKVCQKFKDQFNKVEQQFDKDTQLAASNYREIAKTNALIDNQNLTHSKNRNSVHNISNTVQNQQRQVQIANDESYRRDQNLFLLRLLLFYVILIIILFLIKRAVGDDKFTNSLLIILLVAISIPFIYILIKNLWSIRKRSNNRWSLRNYSMDYSKMPGFPRDGRGGGGRGGGGRGGDSDDDDSEQDHFNHLSKKEKEKICKSTLSPSQIQEYKREDKELRAEIKADKKKMNQLRNDTRKKMKALEKEMKKTNQELCDIDDHLDASGVKHKKCMSDKDFKFDFNINT
jgi:hypothetical protein